MHDMKNLRRSLTNDIGKIIGRDPLVTLSVNKHMAPGNFLFILMELGFLQTFQLFLSVFMYVLFNSLRHSRVDIMKRTFYKTR